MAVALSEAPKNFHRGNLELYEGQEVRAHNGATARATLREGWWSVQYRNADGTETVNARLDMIAACSLMNLYCT